jgi:methionyl-tRNA synthetase
MTISRAASYFISTPIYYVNSKPHIGHLYSSLFADAIARWQIVKSRQPPKIIFSTGTDEHGLKIERAAKAAQLTPLEFCNQISGRTSNENIEEMIVVFFRNISYNV